ncbi:hypothetical protein RHOER0001_6676 [Rhodococcus erythropolis SK121]|nr:hypothetical protein RHOER0001_6676 [Rhodococcus erythropolis SK121]
MPRLLPRRRRQFAVPGRGVAGWNNPTVRSTSPGSCALTTREGQQLRAVRCRKA